MAVLVVGSVALDAVETPFGKADDVIGGSAVFFAAAAAAFGAVQVVGVVGDDYPLEKLAFLREKDVDFSGLETAEGESFRWAGAYSYDLNSRETLETRLGVFAEFSPKIPDAFREARIVFLGNIDPELQIDVLDQVRSPSLVACDTMNYWIDGSRDSLLRLLERVDLLMVNDGEVRQLAGDPNLVRAARWVHAHGPRIVVVKKGEHGAILFTEDSIFFAPGYPLEQVFDPTGAGDAFAGGFLGYLDGVPEITTDALRRAVVYGSVMGSFAVEAFSVDRFQDLEAGDIDARVREFREMTAFEHHLPQESHV